MTMHVMPLPGRDRFLERGHPLQPREPATGYASRLAALNGVPLMSLLTDMRISHWDLWKGNEAELTSLAALRGLREDAVRDLVRYTPRAGLPKKLYAVAGHRLLPRSVITTSSRVCPHCIAEDLDEFTGPTFARPWQRLEWMLDHVRSCGRHGTLLIGLIGSKQSHRRFDFSQAVAQQVLPKLDSLRASAVQALGAGYGAWIVGRIDGAHPLGNWLDEAPLHAAVAFCEALGFSAMHDPRARPMKTRFEDLARAAEEGFRVASQGPEAVEALLDRIVGTHFRHTRGSAGHGRVYGQVHVALRRVMDDPGFDTFRHVLREHAFRSLPISPGTSFLGVPLEERRVHSQRSAATSMSMTDVRLRRLVGASESAAVAARDEAPLRIPVTEFDRLVAGMREYINAKEISAQTGLDIRQIRRLAERGLLKELPDTSRRAGARYRFRRVDVDSFLKRMFRHAVPVDGPSGRRMKVETVASHYRVAAVDIIQLIHDGQCKWVGSTGKENLWRNLLVDADEVYAGLDRTSNENLADADVLAMLPFLRRPDLAALARAGLLEWIDGYSPPGPRPRRGIKRTSVEAFAAAYVTLGEIAAAMGFSVYYVTCLLRKAGVKQVPLCDPVKLYRRADVTSYLKPVTAGQTDC
ncbi:TniQ family protein [Methylobacterium sp. 285MFTsu5.1]|uniref:TniQ family protein n=1 Tax=Methylobacterium sp. 285MFTsu5.1 TaxID=1172187 RepID=UPI00035FF2D9|nr:TniQ family protein [Methylobacterium sp. 285MFTsu5.1]